MARAGFQKINDLSKSDIRSRFKDQGKLKTTSNKAIVFGRVSIIRNKEKGTSDISQRENMDEYCGSHGLIVVHSMDVAETAFNHEARKHFKEIDKLLRADPTLQHVVFSHVSRASRNKESALMIEEWAIKLGVVIHFAREGLMLHNNATDMTWLEWTFKVNQHERESHNTRQNVWEGMLKNVEQGVYPARGPFGYKNIRVGKQAAFELNGSKAKYMKEAFEVFSLGNYSVPALKKELDRKYSEIQATPNKKQLDTLLRNPFYYGDFIWDGRLFRGNPDFHPPLIGFDLWKKVESIFKNPNRSRKKVTKRNHPYLGLIKCSGKLLDSNGNETDRICGAAITCEEKRKKYKDGRVQIFQYYHCSQSTHRCSQRDVDYLKARGRKVNIGELELERILATVIIPLRFDEQVCAWMRQILVEDHRNTSDDHKQHLAALRGREQMLHTYLDKSYEDKLAGNISEELWREKNSNWNSELAEVRKKIEAIGEQKEGVIENGALFIELVQNAINAFENGDSEKKRKMVEIVSSNLRLSNGSLEFDYRKPFDVLAVGGDFEKWRTRKGSNL
jgi:site-specific DNA recombinase